MSDDILHRLEKQSRVRHARIRLMLLEAERLDILADYDQAMKDNQTGVSSARGIWHALSPAQRRALSDIEIKASNTHRLATRRALVARGLILAGEPDQITEHGRFVLKFGPT